MWGDAASRIYAFHLSRAGVFVMQPARSSEGGTDGRCAFSLLGPPLQARQRYGQDPLEARVSRSAARALPGANPCLPAVCNASH